MKSIKCVKCNGLFDNVAEWEDHNKACKSYGYEKLFVPKKRTVTEGLKSDGKKPEIESRRDEMPKANVKVIETPKKTRVKKGK